MNASGSDIENNGIPISSQKQNKKPNFQAEEEFKASDYKSHVDDDLLADIAKVSQNLNQINDQNNNNLPGMVKFEDFDFYK